MVQLKNQHERLLYMAINYRLVKYHEMVCVSWELCARNNTINFLVR